MDFFADYLAKAPASSDARRLGALLERECQPVEDTEDGMRSVLEEECATIKSCFGDHDKGTAVSGDAVETARARVSGESRRKTADIYLFTGNDGDPIRLIECKYRKKLPNEPGKELKERELFEDVSEKMQQSKEFLRLHDRQTTSRFLICNRTVAEILKSDYWDYCDEQGEYPLFRITDSVGLKEAL